MTCFHRRGLLSGNCPPKLGSSTDGCPIGADAYVSSSNRPKGDLMPDLKLVDLGRQANFVDLNAQLIGYADRVEELQSPDQVLNELHAVTTRHLPLQVMGAARFPLKS